MPEPEEPKYDPFQSGTDHDADDTHPAFVGANSYFVRADRIVSVKFSQLNWPEGHPKDGQICAKVIRKKGSKTTTDPEAIEALKVHLGSDWSPDSSEE